MDEIDQLIARLVRAAERVVDPYFNLPIAGAQPVLRERVYAYELFHRLRSQRDEIRSPFLFSAEIDKRGHPQIDDLSIPDLVFHVPGAMRNGALIEIKRTDSTDLSRDLAKFDRYLVEFDYAYGVWLVFGELEELEFVQKFQAPFARFAERGRLLWHRTSGARPFVFRGDEL